MDALETSSNLLRLLANLTPAYMQQTAYLLRVTDTSSLPNNHIRHTQNVVKALSIGTHTC